MSEEAAAPEAAPEVAPEAIVEGEAPPEVEGSEEAPAEGAESLDPESNEAASEEAKEEVKDTLKRLNIKVDGQEIEKVIDVANEAELIKILQMAEMSGKRAQKASELEKKDSLREAQLDDFFTKLKSDPGAILEQLGIDTKTLSESILQKEVEMMELTPAERELMEAKEKLTQLEEEKTTAENARKDAERSALEDKYAADLQRDLDAAMKEYQLPNDAYIVDKMVSMMTTAMQNGIDVSFADLAPIVQEHRNADVRSSVKGMSAEQILEIISEDAIRDIVLKKSPKAEAKKAPPTANSIKEGGEVKEETPYSKKRTKSASEFFRNLR